MFTPMYNNVVFYVAMFYRVKLFNKILQNLYLYVGASWRGG